MCHSGGDECRHRGRPGRLPSLEGEEHLITTTDHVPVQRPYQETLGKTGQGVGLEEKGRAQGQECDSRTGVGLNDREMVKDVGLKDMVWLNRSGAQGQVDSRASFRIFHEGGRGQISFF